MHNLFCIEDKALFVLLWTAIFMTIFCSGMMIWTFWKDNLVWVYYYIMMFINIYLINENIKCQSELIVYP